MPTSLTDRLGAFARSAGTPPGVPPARAAQEPTVLADRPDGTVVALGGVVAKAHPPGTDPAELAVRVATAAHPRLAGVVLPPLVPAGDPAAPGRTAPLPVPRRLSDGRLATLWPRGTPVAPDAPEAFPWETAGTLLARLHGVPPGALAAELPGPLPPMRGPAKAARALARMRAALGSGSAPPRDPGGELRRAAGAVERAWLGLPGWCRAEEPPPSPGADIVCHGDFHLGQLVRFPFPGGPWRLIDVDDLGVGEPAWDLARPAAWYAAGLLPAGIWERFLGAYQAEAGTPGADPWPGLDAPARAVTAQTAALGVAKAHAARRPLDEAELACVDACARIADIAEAAATGSAVTGRTGRAGP